MYRFFEWILELIGWIRIMLSPTLIGGLCSLVVYGRMPGATGLILSLIIAASGLVIGAIWATRIWKKQGTMHFLSRIIATPELDNPEPETKKTQDNP